MPYLVGRFVDRGDDAYVNEGTLLEQAGDASSQSGQLDAGAANPRGYWNGGVSGALYAGREAQNQVTRAFMAADM